MTGADIIAAIILTALAIAILFICCIGYIAGHLKKFLSLELDLEVRRLF